MRAAVDRVGLAWAVPEAEAAELLASFRTWRDRERIYLQVIDEGDGIAATDVEHIFDKFYRAQKTDQVKAGTGLGLSIARGFVEAMQGSLTAANRPDRPGAVFTIALPQTAATQALETAA